MEQYRYAALDAYAQMICYQEMNNMNYIDPKKVKAPTKDTKILLGADVLLYTRNKSAMVAEGKYKGIWEKETAFGVVTEW